MPSARSQKEVTACSFPAASACFFPAARSLRACRLSVRRSLSSWQHNEGHHTAHGLCFFYCMHTRMSRAQGPINSQYLIYLQFNAGFRQGPASFCFSNFAKCSCCSRVSTWPLLWMRFNLFRALPCLCPRCWPSPGALGFFPVKVGIVHILRVGSDVPEKKPSACACKHV